MNKVFFGEIAYIRILLIILLVFYHAFIIHNNGWHEPIGFYPIELYKWLDQFSFAFMLEAFCMISGFIFGYQFYKKSIRREFIYSKIKRLLFPSVIFSLIYIIMFNDIKHVELLYEIFNGAGHLWFLPMLFWCFIISYTLLKLRLKTRWYFLIAFILSLFSFLSLPFRISSTFYYLFSFMLGVNIYRNRDKIINWTTWGKAYVAIIGYIIFFFLLTMLTEALSNYANLNIQYKLLWWIVSLISKLFYSTLGCICIYMVMTLIFKKINNISKLLLNISNLCFGVYIYQQFILIIIYYHTNIPQIVGNVYLPWIGFFVTLIISLFLSYITHLTKLGRYLVG